MSDEPKDDSIDIGADMVLEPPPAPETPVTSFEKSNSFFSLEDEGMALLNAKFVVVESFLKLLTKDIKFPDLVREMLLSIMKVVKSEAGSILEVDYGNDCLFFRAVVGQSSDNLKKFTVPMGQGIVGHVAESQQPLVVANAEENQMHLKAIAKAVGFEARNLVAVPILIRGKTYGVLELLNRVGEPDYTAGDLDLLNYFCEMAAKVLEVRFMIAWSAKIAASKKEDAA